MKTFLELSKDTFIFSSYRSIKEDGEIVKNDEGLILHEKEVLVVDVLSETENFATGGLLFNKVRLTRKDIITLYNKIISIEGERFYFDEDLGKLPF